MQALQPRCWIMTEGIAGTENQCLGLAEALGLTPMIKRIKLRFPWKQLAPLLPGLGLASNSDAVEAPWPDLLIASGRKAIGAALYIKKKSPKTFVIIIQNPRVNLAPFDLVIAPLHDNLRGENVLSTLTSLHRVTAEKCAKEAEKFPFLAQSALPRVAVLIGGKSKTHDMSPTRTQQIAKQIKALSQNHFVMVTASRRTGEDNRQILEAELKNPHIFFWDGAGDNPYFAFLHLADYILVTEDSVSMTSEALSTGKPVYTLSLDGGGKRLNLFHKNLREAGFTRPFTGALEQWSYTPPHETTRSAAEIKRRMQKNA